MLSYIIGIVQRFENMHNRSPNVVEMNCKHFQQLCKEVPALLDSSTDLTLGLKILILPEESCVHPRVRAVIPHRVIHVCSGKNSGLNVPAFKY
jgi:hypothetical protein